MSKEIKKINQGALTTNTKGKLKFADLNKAAQESALGVFELPRLFYQLVFFVIDGSKSMESTDDSGVTKGEQIDKGIRSILKRLKSSKNNKSFDVCFTAFSDEYNNPYGIQRADKIKDEHSFNPLNFVDPQGTKLQDAFEHIKEESLKYLTNNQEKSSQVLIIILSDGAITDYKETMVLVEELKEEKNITIACQFLETQVDEDGKYYSWDEVTDELDYESKWTIEEVKASKKIITDRFKKMASSDELFLSTIDPEEVRKHMIKSISEVSKVLEGSKAKN
jgi:uncharacterized protein YegL